MLSLLSITSTVVLGEIVIFDDDVIALRSLSSSTENWTVDLEGKISDKKDLTSAAFTSDEWDQLKGSINEAISCGAQCRRDNPSADCDTECDSKSFCRNLESIATPAACSGANGTWIEQQSACLNIKQLPASAFNDAVAENRFEVPCEEEKLCKRVSSEGVKFEILVVKKGDEGRGEIVSDEPVKFQYNNRENIEESWQDLDEATFDGARKVWVSNLFDVNNVNYDIQVQRQDGTKWTDLAGSNNRWTTLGNCPEPNGWCQGSDSIDSQSTCQSAGGTWVNGVDTQLDSNAIQDEGLQRLFNAKYDYMEVMQNYQSACVTKGSTWGSVSWESCKNDFHSELSQEKAKELASAAWDIRRELAYPAVRELLLTLYPTRSYSSFGTYDREEIGVVRQRNKKWDWYMEGREATNENTSAFLKLLENKPKPSTPSTTKPWWSQVFKAFSSWFSSSN
jgi:hypothetical protein